MILNNKTRWDITERANAAAEKAWYAQDGDAERLRDTWSSLGAYKLYAANCAVRQAELSDDPAELEKIAREQKKKAEEMFGEDDGDPDDEISDGADDPDGAAPPDDNESEGADPVGVDPAEVASQHWASNHNQCHERFGNEYAYKAFCQSMADAGRLGELVKAGGK